MIVQVKAFGMARELVGKAVVQVEAPEPCTVADLKRSLHADYPSLSHLLSYRMAVNLDYADDSFPVHEQDEIAIIPPVSGG